MGVVEAALVGVDGSRWERFGAGLGGRHCRSLAEELLRALWFALLRLEASVLRHYGAEEPRRGGEPGGKAEGLAVEETKEVT